MESASQQVFALVGTYLGLGWLILVSFAVVHNIPSPYRVYLFSLLHEQLEKAGIQFHVHFMATAHFDRPHWKLEPERLTFPYTFWRDIGPRFGGKEWHLNPGMIEALGQSYSEYLMIGGPWDSFTGMFLSVLARRGTAIAWLEGNASTPGRTRGWVGRMKRFLLRKFDYVAVPGSEGEHYLEMLFAGASFPKSVILPNIVDESKFSPGWEAKNHQVRQQVREEIGINASTRLAVWPARFIPQKGILEFLSFLRPDILHGWKVLLIGRGPLEKKIRERIESLGLGQMVWILGYVPYERMPAIYKAGDLFLLPSLEDSNPLSVVEALHSGLPLLLSRRVGNFPEALREGLNGWGFDPVDAVSVERAVKSAFGADKEILSWMGRHSLRIAKEFWSSRKSVERFLRTVLW